MFRSVCQGTSEGTYCILEDDDGDTWIYINPGQSQWTDNMIQKADPKWLEDKRKNSVGIMLWKKINHQKEKKNKKHNLLNSEREGNQQWYALYFIGSGLLSRYKERSWSHTSNATKNGERHIPVLQKWRVWLTVGILLTGISLPLYSEDQANQ